MLILSLHIFIAVAMTVSTLAVYVAAYSRQETRAYRAMLVTFGITILSGAGLLAVSAAGLGRFCAVMSVFTLSVLLARAFYRNRSLAIVE